MVMTALRHVAVLAKGRCEAESFSTMRSSCGTSDYADVVVREKALALYKRCGPRASHAMRGHTWREKLSTRQPLSLRASCALAVGARTCLRAFY